MALLMGGEIIGGLKPFITGRARIIFIGSIVNYLLVLKLNEIC